MAVDFSLANLTFGESCCCLHSLKPGQPNDYIDALKSVQKAFNRFAQFNLGYGFGACPVKDEGPSRDLISMTSDLNNPFVDTTDPYSLVKYYA